MFCMNSIDLCDISLRWKTDNELTGLIDRCSQSPEKVYCGSYFCGMFFLHFVNNQLEIIKGICRSRKIKIVLVIPVFSQSILDEGKNAVQNAADSLGDDLDCIVVNDYGMLNYISKEYGDTCIGLGRLFAKDSRDFRYDELRNRNMKSSFIEGSLRDIAEEYKVSFIELDNIYECIDENALTDMHVVLHTPYVYQSVGHICCYANMEGDANDIFIANKKCGCSCSGNLITYGTGKEQIIRLGRAVLYKDEKLKICDDSIEKCYFPLDEWMNEYENTGTS